jgi:hypothetical protein
MHIDMCYWNYPRYCHRNQRMAKVQKSPTDAQIQTPLIFFFLIKITGKLISTLLSSFIFHRVWVQPMKWGKIVLVTKCVLLVTFSSEPFSNNWWAWLDRVSSMSMTLEQSSAYFKYVWASFHPLRSIWHNKSNEKDEIKIWPWRHFFFHSYYANSLEVEH